MGDEARQVKYYQEAIRVGSSGIPLFNLALHYDRKGDRRQALQAVDRAIEREKSAPYFILKAQICEAMGDERGRKRSLALGRNVFGKMGYMSDWVLGWYLSAARMAQDTETARQAEEEQKRRKHRRDSVAIGQGILPGAGHGSTRCNMESVA